MLSKIRSTTVHSPALEVIPDTATGSNGSPAATDPDRAPAQAPAAPAQSDPRHGSAAAEREERRHQRALAREGHGREREGHSRERGAKTGDSLQQSTSQPSTASRQGRLVIGETVTVGVIGIIAVGLIVGAILGALSAPGWVIGLLVATLTVILSTVLRRFRAQH